MTAVDLHALPPGSVVSIGWVVAIRSDDDDVRPWHLAPGGSEGYSVGHLLAMSQDWVVLRNGIEIPGTGTPEIPEVRHYISVVDVGRVHTTMTSARDDGRIVGKRHPWEPMVFNGGTWYRVGPEVATKYMAERALLADRLEAQR